LKLPASRSALLSPIERMYAEPCTAP
jgi:hypothetical protein